MASRSQEPAAHQESPTAIDGIARGTEQTSHSSSPNCLGLASVSPDDAAISDALNHADHSNGQSTSSNRQLYPVIYTKHHFEVLKLGAVQYTIDMLRRHEKRGVVISPKDIDRHWRRQIRREYSPSRPLSTALEKKASHLIFLR